MKKGYVNWKLVLVLVLGLCAVGATVIGLRKYNRTQRAEQGLKKGLAAYENKHWQAAASGLGQYLAIHPSEIDILLKYGHAQGRIQPFKQGNYAQAVNAFRSVLRLEEDNLEAALALTELYLQSRTPGEAELVASRFLEKQYDSQLTLRLAAAQIMQRKYEEAAQLLTDMLPREPSEIRLYEMLAAIARQRPELLDKSPREWIEAAVVQNPRKAEAYILQANFLTEVGQREAAQQSLKQAADCDVANIQTRLSLAAAWLRLDAVTDAEEHLDAVFSEDPKSPELWQLRAIAAEKSQDAAKAADVAREALEYLDDARGAFLPYAAELFIIAGDTDKARHVLRDMRDFDTGGGLVNYLEGLLAERDGDWSQAMIHWREAVVQGYTAEPVHLKLAEGAMRLEDRTSAIETLRRYVSQHPGSFKGQFMLAHILAESRQWPDASQYAAAAVNLNPQNRNAQSLLRRIRIELLAGQPEFRRHVDQLLVELTGDDDTLQNHLLAFRVALSRKDWTTAQRTLESLAERYGPSLPLQTAWAEYYMARQQPKQAAAILEEAIASYPDASEPAILRAALYVDEKNTDRSLAVLKEAVTRLEGSHLRRVQLAMVDFYRQTNRTQDAVDLLAEMAVNNPHDIPVRRQLLALKRTDGDSAQLQRRIDEIKQIEGQTGRIWKIEQVLLWQARGELNNRYSQAVSLLNENLTANPDDKQSLMLLAAAHEQVGNTRLAVSLFQDSVSRHPGDIDLAIAAMGAMYRAEDFRQAEQLLADLLAAGYSDPRLAQLELQSLIRQGRLDSAEDILEKMVIRNAADTGARLSLAMLKTRSGQFDAAKKLIDELISENPDAIVSQAVLADWHLRQNQPQEALAVCDDFLNRYDTIQAYKLRCQVLLAAGETDKAIQDIESILQRADNDPDIWLNVSELYITAGLPDKGLEAVRQSLAIRPDSFEAQKQAALLLLLRPQHQQEGIELLESAIAQQPRDPQLRMRKAAILLGRGGKAAVEAIQILNSLLEEFPRLEQAWLILTEWYLLNNQPGMAMDTALRGLAALPDNRMLMMAKARIEALRSPSLALETLTQLARRFPADESIIEMQAQMLRRIDKPAQAVELLHTWLAQNESSSAFGIKLSLMGLLYETGDIAQAEQLYEQLLAEPDASQAAVVQWLQLIGPDADTERMVAAFRRWYDGHPQGAAVALPILQNLLELKNEPAVQAAEQILTLIQTRKPDSSEAAYGMAMLYHMTGRKRQAVPLYERALELQPDNVIAMNNLAWILSQDFGEYEKALQLADKGLAQAPHYTDLMDTRGNIYFTLGQYEKAAEDFKAAVDGYRDSQPQKTVSLFYLGQCLKRLGRNEQAVNEFYRARDLDEKTGGLSSQQREELTEILQ